MSEDNTGERASKGSKTAITLLDINDPEIMNLKKGKRTYRKHSHAIKEHLEHATDEAARTVAQWRFANYSRFSLRKVIECLGAKVAVRVWEHHICDPSTYPMRESWEDLAKNLSRNIAEELKTAMLEYPDIW